MCACAHYAMKFNYFDFAMFSHTRQRGIGFIGFLVGIVVGIAVALAVAVYITKVPTPFTDKIATKTQEEQAAEQERAKNWNPNAALAGGAIESPGQTAPPPVALKPEEQAANAQVDTNMATPALPGWEGAVDNSANKLAETDRERILEQARSEAEAQANASTDPIDSLLQARGKTIKTPSASQTPRGGFIYFVQVGAFRESNGAERQKARVSMLGMQARINRRKRAGRNVYQVRLGPFQNKSQADAARNKLAGSGMDTALVRVQR